MAEINPVSNTDQSVGGSIYVENGAHLQLIYHNQSAASFRRGIHQYYFEEGAHVTIVNHFGGQLQQQVVFPHFPVPPQHTQDTGVSAITYPVTDQDAVIDAANQQTGQTTLYDQYDQNQPNFSDHKQDENQDQNLDHNLDVNQDQKPNEPRDQGLSHLFLYILSSSNQLQSEHIPMNYKSENQ